MILFDNLTDTYKQLNGKNIKVYVCGPTVYNFCHIGHGRSFIVFDLLHRVLLKSFDKVQFVQNITDIAESIDNKAQEEKCDAQNIVNKYLSSFYDNIKILNIYSVTRIKVSDFIPQIIQDIEKMMNHGHAYLKNDGVYFKIGNFDYDLFENRQQDVDFALWKFRNNGFQSPWGVGIPGWHIECSTMFNDTLGNVIDIHGGGCDLKFPHHQNEIVQCWALQNNAKLNKFSDFPAKIWMHNNMLNLNGIKMSKSLGNCFFINDIVKNEYDADVFRYMILKTHYSKILEFNEDEWLRSQHEMNIIRAFYFKHCKKEIVETNNNINILRNDLDSSTFLNTLMKFKEDWQVTMNMINLLGFNMKIKSTLTHDEIDSIVQNRLLLRKQGNYTKADEIRLYLSNNYVTLEDFGDQTNWHFV